MRNKPLGICQIDTCGDDAEFSVTRSDGFTIQLCEVHYRQIIVGNTEVDVSVGFTKEDVHGS